MLKSWEITLRKDTIVIDLDGTLANTDHRVHLVKAKKWREFYAQCPKDTLNQWCAEIVRLFFRGPFEVVILTARSKEVQSQTIEWITKHLEVSYVSCLRMVREENDNSKDFDLKLNWARNHGLGRILFAIDDRKQVADMWRKEGVTCLQCAEGDF